MNLQERNSNRAEEMSMEPNLSRGGSSYAIKKRINNSMTNIER